MFGPDTSTGNQATLGGMIGNNSAGSGLVRYGMTIDLSGPWSGALRRLARHVRTSGRR